ncbi:MAG: fluoride efflux transporter FluC [Streptosporangiaceae bacterium]
MAGSRQEARPQQVRSADWRSERPFAFRQIPWPALAAISAGGVLGALARQGLWAMFRQGSGVDWTTLCINIGGCALIGVLMTILTEVRHAHRLTVPFLGVGVLGGFTTFSAYIVGIQKLITSGTPQSGLAYLAATLAGALLATYAGVRLARLLGRPHRRQHRRSPPARNKT